MIASYKPLYRLLAVTLVRGIRTSGITASTIYAGGIPKPLGITVSNVTHGGLVHVCDTLSRVVLHSIKYLIFLSLLFIVVTIVLIG